MTDTSVSLPPTYDLFCRIYEDDQIKRMRWVGHVARMGKEGSLHTSSYYENLKKRDAVEDVGIC